MNCLICWQVLLDHPVDQVSRVHQAGLDSLDQLAHQVTQDSPVHVETDQDRLDHQVNVVNVVFKVLVVQLVPVDLQDQQVQLETWDLLGRPDNLELEVGTVTEDHQDLVDFVDDLDRMDHRDLQDGKVILVH